MMRMDALRVFGLMVVITSVGCFALRKPAALKSGGGTPRMSSTALGEDETPPKIEPPPMPVVPAKPTSVSKDEAVLRRLADRAVEKERSLETYNVRLRRRERSNGVLQPTEVLLLKYRRAPFSVHFKWLGEEATGREILYVKGQHEGKVHVHTGRGDLFGPGFRLSFAPDSQIVRSKFHYDIHEAGINAAVSRFALQRQAIERKQPNCGVMRYLGRQMRSEFASAMDAVEQELPPGLEPILPRGGTRKYYFDDATGLPLVVQTFDRADQEVEYYCFDRLQTPVALDDADFDPALLWPKRKRNQ